MTTRCKFECVSVRKYKGWGGNQYLFEAEFQAVTSGGEENKAFFAATPQGTLKVATVKQDVFEVGKSYFIDITLAF